MQTGYALVLGNIMHSVFEQKLQDPDNNATEFLDKIIQSAMSYNYTQLYQTGQTTDKVFADVHKCLANMQEWLSQIVDVSSNGYGI